MTWGPVHAHLCASALPPVGQNARARMEQSERKRHWQTGGNVKGEGQAEKREREGITMETSAKRAGTPDSPRMLSLRIRHFLWESGVENIRCRNGKKVNKVRRGVYNETNSCSNQFGRGREEFQLQCYSHIIPQTYILSSYIVWHLELLGQLRLKVLLKSNLLSPFVYFVGVPHFRQ